MNRPLRVIIILGIAALVFLIVWKVKVNRGASPVQSSLEDKIQSAMASPKEFVRSRVTGGVGVALMMDGASGLPKVGSVLPGSPAQSAGLLRDDIITKVGNWETEGQSLSNVVETLRGFAGAKVMVTVRRATAAGTTNLTFAIHRSSWNSLGITNSVTPTPATAITNLGPILPGTNATN